MSNPGTEIQRTEQQARGVPVALNGRQDNFDAAYRLAKNLAMSGIIPRELQGKPADVLVIVLYGQELGLAPMQAMQVIDVVKGRPALRANLWVALARKAGHKVRVTDETATSCTVSVVRHDDPEPCVVEYTLDDAKTAGLLSNDNYRKNPKAMLYARAASTAIRRACPEVALGFSDEYELAEPEPARPTLAQVAAERTDRGADIVAASTHGRLNGVPDPVPAAEPEVDEDAAMAAEMAAIEAEHQAEYGEAQPDTLDLGGEH
ncbi:MAG TPA: hypothetical protein VFV67_33920 [Actinophytocola sp.]|uniref:hypothetical protein n=1 Tax=Actinophytocola sp. TaxID=1872138 RepID=UPI002DB80B73|nr:hypothetical protein [Actinophytocola sp.]HEU5475665.1 hypothetical protein [Actinophytocola sp.]